MIFLLDFYLRIFFEKERGRSRVLTGVVAVRVLREFRVITRSRDQEVSKRNKESRRESNVKTFCQVSSS